MFENLHSILFVERRENMEGRIVGAPWRRLVPFYKTEKEHSIIKRTAMPRNKSHFLITFLDKESIYGKEHAIKRIHEFL